MKTANIAKKKLDEISVKLDYIDPLGMVESEHNAIVNKMTGGT